MPLRRHVNPLSSNEGGAITTDELSELLRHLFLNTTHTSVLIATADEWALMPPCPSKRLGLYDVAIETGVDHVSPVVTFCPEYMATIIAHLDAEQGTKFARGVWLLGHILVGYCVMQAMAPTDGDEGVIRPAEVDHDGNWDKAIMQVFTDFPEVASLLNEVELRALDTELAEGQEE